MGICLHAVFRRSANPTVSVPAPVDAKTPEAPWWYDRLSTLCAEWASLGVTSILLPPPYKTSAGSYPGADGYGVYDDYDIGGKNQFYSKETRFGNRQQLQRLCAVAAANGIQVYVDFVPHQRSGGNYGKYRYLGSDGKTFNGRFPKDPGCFRGDPAKGYVNQDPVASPSDDWAFGDELSPINSKPHDYVAQGLIDAGDWIIRTLGLEGGRIDDTKGMAVPFVKRWVTSKAMRGKYFFGEFADGNPSTLHWWVRESGMDGLVSTADFSFHYRIKDMCEKAGRWDMRQLDHMSYAGLDPAKAFTFVENQDSDTNGFGQVAFNKAAAYFVMLTIEGYPCIYYRDWSKDDGCYGWGMQKHINNYMWINANLASGSTICRYKDFQCNVYERQGGKKLLCGINNDPSHWWKQMWVQTGFGPNVHLHDYTGHAGDLWTNADGWVNISLPPNVNGLGTVAYAPAGLDKEIDAGHGSITQTFFGAEDLDIGPLNSKGVSLTPIYCEKGTKISIKLRPQRVEYPNDADLVLTLKGPDGATIEKVTSDPEKNSAHIFNVKSTGWHEFSLLLDTSTEVSATFELECTYTAPRTIKINE